MPPGAHPGRHPAQSGGHPTHPGQSGGHPAHPGHPGYPGHSGLFPAKGPHLLGHSTAVPRPIYRELLPVTAGRGAIGILAGTLWMGLFGLLASSARGYVWWTIIAAVLAWPVLAVLTRFGDRGVAVGAAVSTGFGLAIAGLVVAVRSFGGEWLLW